MENKSFTQNTNFGFSNGPSDGQKPPLPYNYMPLAIVSTVLGLCGSFCCVGLILGIIAIVYASQVNSKYNYGDYAGAEQSAKNAKILGFIALGIDILGIVVSIIQLIMMGTDGTFEMYRQIIEQYSNT